MSWFMKMTDHHVVPIPKKRPSNKRPVLRVLFAVLVLFTACIISAGAFFLARQVTLQWSGSTGLLGPQIEQSSGTPA
jgi:hypothetical protein